MGYSGQIGTPSCESPVGSAILSKAYHRVFTVERAESDAQREEVFRLRYRTYCEEMGFIDPAEKPDGLESDAYDSRSRHVLLRLRNTGAAVGTVRVILPAEDDASDSFPLQHGCEHPLVHDADRVRVLCEISRLCVIPDFRQFGAGLANGISANPLAAAAAKKLVPYVPIGLFKGAFEWILDLGRLECIAIMEPKLIRRLKSIDFICQELGPPVDYVGVRQPVYFDLYEIFQHGYDVGARFYDLMADNGRLHELASRNHLARLNHGAFGRKLPA
ncbi:MAG: PEP-CTERM/exosortase system-associated acyltransferase [Acidimicrobiia bacterium]